MADGPVVRVLRAVLVGIAALAVAAIIILPIADLALARIFWKGIEPNAQGCCFGHRKDGSLLTHGRQACSAATLKIRPPANRATFRRVCGHEVQTNPPHRAHLDPVRRQG